MTYLTPEQAAAKQQQPHGEESKTNHDLVPTIVDIGCGYGGLMFELQKEFPQNLILGMEIRDVVANFVAQKINSIRINSKYKECLNVGVVKTNTMKTLHNYFRKESVRANSAANLSCICSLKRCSSALPIHTSRSKITVEE